MSDLENINPADGFDSVGLMLDEVLDSTLSYDDESGSPVVHLHPGGHLQEEFGDMTLGYGDEPSLFPNSDATFDYAGDTLGGSDAVDMKLTGGNTSDTNSPELGATLGYNNISLDIPDDATLDHDQSPGIDNGVKHPTAPVVPPSKGPNYRLVSYDATDQSTTSDYVVEREIGRGGMGVVFEAQQYSVGRRIAIKMLPPEMMQNPKEREKFLSEAVVMADLDHPNIVPFYDLGQCQTGNLFYTMKRVKGVSWDDTIGDRTLQENLSILMSLCDAVAYAHDRGVVHRDIKPSNVMLGRYGEVLLMDWGIAVSFLPERRVRPLTAVNAKGGTPSYMAPEMLSGDPTSIGPWCDVYLMGACLFRIVTGLRPHGGADLQECLDNIHNNVIQQTEVRNELLDIASKAMSTSREDRYASVEAFQEALQEYLSHQESIALCHEAQDNLKTACFTGEYDLFSQARYGFRSALSLFPKNRDAACGLIEVETEYAIKAYECGDYDLAISLLNPQEDKHREIYQKVELAIVGRNVRARRHSRMRKLVLALTVLIILVLSVAVVWIRESRQIALEQRSIAEQEAERAGYAEKREHREKQVALFAQAEEEKQRKAAEAARLESETARALAVKEKARAEDALKIAEEAREREKIQREIADIERTKAVNALNARLAAEKREQEAKNSLARIGALREDKSWVFDAQQARQLQTDVVKEKGIPKDMNILLPGGVSLDMVLIPPGGFVMGSPTEEADRKANEYLHRVTISRPYYMAVSELTVAQYQALIGREDTSKQRVVLPKIGLSWLDAQKLLTGSLQKLAPKGMRFRIPTEAEWEYACRAGTATALYSGADEQSLEQAGWYYGNSKGQLQKVMQKAPNAWGLYDMHGNVMEWCMDGFEDKYYLTGPEVDPQGPDISDKRIARGGCYKLISAYCRSAYRSWGLPGRNSEVVGIRLVLSYEK